MRQTPDLNELVRHLKQALGDRLDAVVLFGSRARGDARPDSDWDLLIVVHGLPLSPLKRQKLWLQVAPEPWRLPADPLLRTPEEWYDNPSSLALDIALDGIILFDARGRMRDYLHRLHRALERAGRKRIHEGKQMLWVSERKGLRPWFKEIWEAQA